MNCKCKQAFITFLRFTGTPGQRGFRELFTHDRKRHYFSKKATILQIEELDLIFQCVSGSHDLDVSPADVRSSSASSFDSILQELEMDDAGRL